LEDHEIDDDDDDDDDEIDLPSISSSLNPRFFVPTSFWQLFSSYMYVEKAAKMTFVRKRREFNVDEIDLESLEI
jgi:hypothetical protein